jgi:pimeloyl-ACP methyl ester carboxylesterase
MREKQLTFQNSKLVFYDSESDKPVILFCHANGYSAGCYKTYFRRLKEDYRIVSIDFIGHGKSESNLNYKNWYFFRDQVLAVLEKENLTNVTGIGHSLGGATLLLSSVVAKERFKKLLVMDPVILGLKLITLSKIFGNPLAKAAAKRRTEFHSMELVRRGYSKFPQFAKFDSEVFSDFLSSCFKEDPTTHKVVLSSDPRVETKTFSMAHYLTYFNFYKIKTETHVLIPNPHEVCSKDQARMITKQNPKSSYEIWDGATHFFPFESPNETFLWMKKKLFES